jgi:hypothetical protein
MQSTPSPLSEQVQEVLEAVGAPSASLTDLFLSETSTPEQVATQMLATAEERAR